MLLSRGALMILSRGALNNGKTVSHRFSARLARPATMAFSASHFSTASSEAPKVLPQGMFCRQCEQTNDHVACSSVGVCGKSAETASCQDTLMEGVKSLSAWAVAARKAGVSEADLQAANVWTLQSAFSTLTNVNFSDERISDYIWQGEAIKKDLKQKVAAAGGSAPSERVASIDLSGKSTIELEEFGHTGKFLNQHPIRCIPNLPSTYIISSP
jgi:hypothetical protein